MHLKKKLQIALMTTFYELISWERKY